MEHQPEPDNQASEIKEISVTHTFAFRTRTSVLKSVKPDERTRQIKWGAIRAASQIQARGLDGYEMHVSVLTALVVPEELEPDLFDAFEVSAVVTFIKAN